MVELIQESINRSLAKDWSPEQIADRLKDEPRISWHHETIYQYIVRDKKNGGELDQFLRHQNKTDRKGDGVEIDVRPQEAN